MLHFALCMSMFVCLEIKIFVFVFVFVCLRTFLQMYLIYSGVWVTLELSCLEPLLSLELDGSCEDILYDDIYIMIIENAPQKTYNLI